MPISNSRRRAFVLVAALLCLGGCGTILNGSVPEADRGSVDGVALVLDIFLTGLLGLLIDVATGGLYKRKGR